VADELEEKDVQTVGAAPQDKRHVLFDTGHAPPQLPVMKEALGLGWIAILAL
jgi:hypothetical protein